MFRWIVFVPRANCFFYINTLNVRWLHALNCFDTTHWNHIGLHIVLFHGFNWMVNGILFFVCPFHIFFLPQDLWIETSIMNGGRLGILRNVIFWLFCEFLAISYEKIFVLMLKSGSYWTERVSVMATHRHKNSQCWKWNWRQNKNKNA